MPKYTAGTVAFFPDDRKLLEAAKSTYKAGFRKFDSITPFPIHGMDQATGIKPSFLPWVAFFGGLMGLAIALGFQSWVNLADWPMNFGGKPGFGVPAMIPITFELTVLISGLSTVGALIAICGLPKMDPPVIDYDLTSHKFALFVPEGDLNYEHGRVESFMKSIGATEVRHVDKY